MGCVACACDSLVWAELGSMFPQSGGSYVYLRHLYGEHTWGRLACFMFVWQFFFIWITTDSVLLWGSEKPIFELAIGFLLVGIVLFLFHGRYNREWPFDGIDGTKKQTEASSSFSAASSISSSSSSTSGCNGCMDPAQELPAPPAIGNVIAI